MSAFTCIVLSLTVLQVFAQGKLHMVPLTIDLPYFIFKLLPKVSQAWYQLACLIL